MRKRQNIKKKKKHGSILYDGVGIKILKEYGYMKDALDFFLKIRFHVMRFRFESLKMFLGHFFYILHLRSFVPAIMKRYLYLMSVKTGGLYEVQVRPYFVIGKNEIFCDVGANEGLYTIYLARKCKQVHAWEPNPMTASMLEASVNKFHNVVVHKEALGDKQEVLPFYLHRISGSDSLVYQDGDSTGRAIKVPVRPLDSYEIQGKIGLIKIDTEGFEVPVVKGALKTIQQHKPRLIIEIHTKKHINEIKRMLPYYRWKKMTTTYDFHLIGDCGNA